MSEAPLSRSKDVPLYRRPWFVLLTFLIFWPLTLLIMWTGKIYYYKWGGGLAPMGRLGKWLMSIGIITLGLIYFAGLAADKPSPSAGSSSVEPNNGNTKTDGSAHGRSAEQSEAPASPEPSPSDQSSEGQQSAEQTDALEPCDSDTTKAALKDIIERDGQTEVLDMGDIQEISCPALNNTDGSCYTPRNERFCNVTLYLSTGTIAGKYHMFFGPSGKPLIQLEQGSYNDWSKMK
jgi:hypothetical protein